MGDKDARHRVLWDGLYQEWYQTRPQKGLVPKQHSIWAPVGPKYGPSWVLVGPNWGPFGNAAWVRPTKVEARTAGVPRNGYLYMSSFIPDLSENTTDLRALFKTHMKRCSTKSSRSSVRRLPLPTLTGRRKRRLR